MSDMSELRSAGAAQLMDEEYEDISKVIEGVRAIEMPFDFRRTDYTWNDQYGITTVPLLVRSASGDLYDDKRWKGIFIDGKYYRIVSRAYTIFPNEETQELITEIAEKQNLTMGKSHFSHFGYAKYWEVLDLNNRVKVEEGDELNLGFVARNSLGAGVALGAEAFTFRLVCSNGAIARGKDLGSVALRHVGNHDEMVERFTQNLHRVMRKSKELVAVYRKATKIKMNLVIAKDFVKYVPERALPDSIEITRKKGKITDIMLTRRDTLWETFNDVTQAVWHNRPTRDQAEHKVKAKWLTKSGVLQRAHWVLLHATGSEAAVAAS